MNEKTKNLISETKKTIDETLDKLADQLEKGYSAEMIEYLKAMSRFHHYSIGNQLLIFSQFPKASRVAGFRTWNKLNRCVRKGQKGIRILAPCLKKKADEDDEQDKVIGFRPAYVFDYSQTDGDEIPYLSGAQGDAEEVFEMALSSIQANGIEFEYGETGRAYGYSTKNRIVLKEGMTSGQNFSVLIHEWAHIHLHFNNGKTPRPIEELEADAVACVVCERFGIDAIQSSADYIKNWDGNKDSLFERLERIRQCASTIIQSIENCALVIET